MVRLGLLLYDHLGGRDKLAGSYGIDLRRDPAGAPLKDAFTKAFCYSDCWVEDSRLVVLNALDARERGAAILTRTRLTAARRIDGLWQATLEPANGGPTRRVTARALVNATGPWVLEVQDKLASANRGAGLRLVKGSHIVVPRMFDGARAYILQNLDRRVIFAIPYERDFTLIGTTEAPFEGDPGKVAITPEETDYLCAAVNRYFARPVAPDDVVWSYSGVRPLYDDLRENLSAVTRDYVFDLDPGTEGAPGAGAGDGAPLISVFGGKITTYRKLAEHALDKLLPFLGAARPAWTERAALPGGDMPGADFDAFLAELEAARPWLPEGLARRLARAYGTRVEALLGSARGLEDLGEDLGGGLTEAEVDYLMGQEWAVGAEDILWRRSKLGLHLSDEDKVRLDDWIGRGDAVTGRALTR
jgi:glycerol-3-phosphate dehydrogenase